MMTYLLQDHREDEAVVYQRHRRSVLNCIHDVLDDLITIGFVLATILESGCWNYLRIVGSVIVSFTRSLEDLKIAVPHILKRHPRRSRREVRCHTLVVRIRIGADADAVRGIVRAVVSGAAEREGRLVRDLRVREREVEGLTPVRHRHYHAHHDRDDDEQERGTAKDDTFPPSAPSGFVWSLWQRSFE